MASEVPGLSYSPRRRYQSQRSRHHIQMDSTDRGRALSANRQLSAERLKWETAMRMYGSDGSSRKLIQQMLDQAG